MGDESGTIFGDDFCVRNIMQRQRKNQNKKYQKDVSHCEKIKEVKLGIGGKKQIMLEAQQKKLCS